jgi:anti-sigma factor RsiW
MTHQWTDRLSEYLDGELSRADADAVDRHLKDCEDCRATLEDLRAVMVRASALEDRAPAADLWPGIAERLPASTPVTPLSAWRRLATWRVSASVPQLAAAAVVLLLVGSGTIWVALGPGDGGNRPAAVTPVNAPAVPVASPAETYGAAIADLDAILDASRGALDTATVRVLEESLLAIDQAIAEAEAALAEDPASRYLRRHLNATMERKLNLLHRAAALAVTSS